MTGTAELNVDEGSGESATDGSAPRGEDAPPVDLRHRARDAHHTGEDAVAAQLPPDDGADRPGTPDRPPERPDQHTAGQPADGAAGEDAGEHPDEPAGEHLAVDEPLLPPRAHRPSDLLRFLAGLLGIVAVFVLAQVAVSTTSGIESDITINAKRIPDLLSTISALVSSVAVLAVPLAFAVERLIKRDGLRVADGVLASVLAYGVSLGVDWWVAASAPEEIRNALTQFGPGGGETLTDPVHGYLAPVIAYMTAVGMSSRPRWRVALWIVVILSGATELVNGYTTPLSLLLTVLIGWSVAYGTLYAIGSPNIRPTGQHLMIGLRKVGFTPSAAHLAPDGPGGTRRYLVVQQQGPLLDVHIIDREQQAPASSTGPGGGCGCARSRSAAARSRCARPWSRRR